MNLTVALDRLLSQAHAHTWADFDTVRGNAYRSGLAKSAVDRWRTPGEPAFVSQLIEYPFARQRLEQLLSKYLSPKVSKGAPLVSGVFIHQKPKVKFGRPLSEIELGDLLLVRHHFQTGKDTPDGRAVLIQAKAAAQPGTGTLTRKKEIQQFDLYADWRTEFTFPHGEIGPPPSGKKWKLSQGPWPNIDTGLYGIVSNERRHSGKGFPDNCVWALGAARPVAAGADKRVDATLSLAVALEGFLHGRHGRPWDIGASASDHWSNFVEEVILRAIPWVYPVQRAGAVDIPRKRTAVAMVNGFAAHNINQYVRRTPRASGTSSDAGFNRFAVSSLNSLQQVCQWASGGSSEEGDFEPPTMLRRERRSNPSGGMSVLYIATFGDGALPPPTEEESGDAARLD